MTAELVHTAVELANREAEVSQLRQALTSRVWIEQAKGMLAVTEAVTLDQAFQRLRMRARSSSRKLAEVAQTGLARRTAALDRADDVLAARQRTADDRDRLADERDRAADERDSEHHRGGD